MNKDTIRLIMGGIFSLIIAMGIGRFSYTPILPLMQKDLSFSNATAGYLATSNYVGYLVGALIAGRALINRNRLSSLRISLVISILTTASMGIFHYYPLWYVFRFLSGIVSALVLVLTSGIVLEKLAQRGKTNWSGIFYGGVGIGILISGLMIPKLNQMFKWQGTWLGLAALSIIFFVFILFYIKETSYTIESQENREVFIRVPPTKWLPWLIVSYSLEGLGYIVTGTFIVSIAGKIPSFSNHSSLVWIVVGLAAVPSCLLWSTFAKKWGYVKALVLALVLQSLGVIMPVLWLTTVSLVISAFLFGATFMGITTLSTILASKISPHNSNKVIGYLTALYAFGQMIGPTIAGTLSSFTHNYNAALTGASGVVFIGALLLLTGMKYESKPIENTMDFR